LMSFQLFKRRAMMKLVPMQDKIVVERLEAEGQSKGGILIPDSAKEKPRQGKVLAVGPGRCNEAGVLLPVNVRSGQVVMFAHYAGNDVELDGCKYLILSESDVLAVVQ
jgi:chaperonin GroES